MSGEAYRCHFCREFHEGRAPYLVKERLSQTWVYEAMCERCRETIENLTFRDEYGLSVVDWCKPAEQEKGLKWLPFFFIVGAAVGALITIFSGGVI